MNPAQANELVAMIGAKGWGRTRSMGLPNEMEKQAEKVETQEQKADKASRSVQNNPRRIGSKAGAALELLRAAGAEMGTACIAEMIGQKRLSNAVRTLNFLRSYGLVEARTQRINGTDVIFWSITPRGMTCEI